MPKEFPKEPTRASLRQSLPGIEPESWSEERIPFTYVPPSHARALEPDSVLVEGIRGAGKSFWWRALSQDAHRQFIAAAFPETRLGKKTRVGQGYGIDNDNQYPSKDVIQRLVKTNDPRQIWKAVIASQLQFPDPYPRSSKWSARVAWVSDNPEEFEEFLVNADKQLANAGTSLIILFDALDRLAGDWETLRPIAKALFQVALDLRSCRAIRLKLFVRPDMIEDREIMAFPDASKLLGQKVSLTWRRVDLYALLFQCLGNDPNHGNDIRKHIQQVYSLKYEQKARGGPWVLPKPLRSEEEIQKSLFHAITGPTMASGPSGHKRGFPYTWLYSHLIDAKSQVSPRSFAAALRAAAEQESPEIWPYAIHYAGLKAGVQKASQIRVDEIVREDYPWVNEVVQPLKQLVVPCPVADLIDRWESDKTVEKLEKAVLNKLPPQHLSEGPKGLIRDLQSLGIIESLSADRIQMPDVYRVAFGLGRRGGIKPVR